MSLCNFLPFQEIYMAAILIEIHPAYGMDATSSKDVAQRF